MGEKKIALENTWYYLLNFIYDVKIDHHCDLLTNRFGIKLPVI